LHLGIYIDLSLLLSYTNLLCLFDQQLATAYSAYSLSQALSNPAEMSTETSIEVARIAKKVLLKPEGLEKRCRQELQNLEGPARWELVKEVARATLLHHEWTALSASVLKSIMDAWTDEEYKEMGVGRAEADADLFFTAKLIPLADSHSENQRRKEAAKQRIADVWGEDWEDEMGVMLPSWPAETFLRDLAVYAEKNPWKEAELYLKGQIQKRIAKPRTRKYTYLTSADLVPEGKLPKWKRAKPRIVQVEEESEQDSLDEDPIISGAQAPAISGASNPVISGAQAPEISGSIQEQARVSTEAPLQEDGHDVESTPPVSPSSLALIVQDRRPPANPPLSESNPVISGAKAPAISGSGVERKKRRRSETEERNAKKRKLDIDIPVINLDVDDRIDFITKKAEEDDDVDKLEDLKFAQEALHKLAGGERIDNELWKRRLRVIHEILMAELVDN
jgi:hypothetical protein